MPSYRVYDIQYDLDDETEINQIADLPTELDIYLDKDQDIAYDGADAISDKTGFCVVTFQYKLKE